MKNKTFRILLVILSLLTVLSFASCAKSESAGDAYYDETVNKAPGLSPEVGMGNDKLNSTTPPADMVERKTKKQHKPCRTFFNGSPCVVSLIL